MLRLLNLKQINKKSLLLFLSLFVLVLAGTFIPSRFAVNTTASAGYRVFFLDKSPDINSVKKDSFVMFELATIYANGGKPFLTIKQVGCDEGDVLKVADKDYYCNDTYLGKAKGYSLKGERLPQFVFNGEIPKGKVFIIGQHKDSFDSRYFGFINKQDIKAIAYKIF